MSFIEQHSLPIIGVLLVLLLISVSIIIKQKLFSEKSDISPHGSDYKDKFNKEFRKREDIQDELDALNIKYYKVNNEKKELKKLNDELTREIHELNVLIEKYKKRGDGTATVEKNVRECAPSKKDSQVIKYASFPRSAGCSIYFSDLTDNLVDDSYFELKVSDDADKASFKPLDFMKIRNYDPAMAAIVTEGVKPNVASTILSIEPGKAHLEGKDWIIDKPAIIKLA